MRHNGVSQYLNEDTDMWIATYKTENWAFDDLLAFSLGQLEYAVFPIVIGSHEQWAILTHGNEIGRIVSENAKAYIKRNPDVLIICCYPLRAKCFNNQFQFIGKYDCPLEFQASKLCTLGYSEVKLYTKEN